MGDATKTSGLRVADGVILPVEYVTKTAAILAQRRKGKTYTAAVLAEELAAARLPWVALDPTGAWWGLRSSADGKRAGLPVVVIGGQHGDVPLERGGGGIVADLVLDHPGWYVLDLSLLESREAEREFSLAFAKRLHRRKMQPGMDFPLHLFVDEADLFVPQEREVKGDNLVLGAFQAIVRRGGLHGLGTTLISQRPALVNKSVLTQLDLLIVLRLVGGQDQDAIDRDYVKRNGTKAERDELMGSLASLRIGEAWLWEPGAEPPLFERVQIRERETFNSSATPKPGERRVEPKVFADVDLDALRDRMAATIERAKDEDPVELRKTIRHLEKRVLEVEQQSISAAAAVVPPERVEVPVLSDEDRALLRQVVDGISEIDAKVHGAAFDLVYGELAPIARLAERTLTVEPDPADLVIGGHVPPVASPPAPAPAPRREPVDDGLPIPHFKAGARRMLSMLARFDPQPLTKIQLGTLADITPNSGTFSDYKNALRSAGVIYEADGVLGVTDAGRRIAAADADLPLPSPVELKAMWAAKFKAGARRMLDELFDVYPDGLTRDELAERVQITRTSGTFSDYLNALKRNHVAVEANGTITAGAALFIGAR